MTQTNKLPDLTWLKTDASSKGSKFKTLFWFFVRNSRLSWNVVVFESWVFDDSVDTFWKIFQKVWCSLAVYMKFCGYFKSFIEKLCRSAENSSQLCQSCGKRLIKIQTSSTHSIEVTKRRCFIRIPNCRKTAVTENVCWKNIEIGNARKSRLFQIKIVGKFDFLHFEIPHYLG